MTQDIIQRIRAAAIILHEDHILLNRGERDNWWTLPGGGAQPGEPARQALVRELNEEMGFAFSVIRTLFVIENFFTLEGKQYHQVEFQFLVRLPVDSPFLDLSQTYHGKEAFWADANEEIPLIFQWFPLKQLSTLTYPIKPQFLSYKLNPIPSQIEYMVWWD